MFGCVHVENECADGANGDEKRCDLFKGKWIWDKSGSYPMYNALECPFISPGLNCQKNGRPDNMYLNFRWQPHGCSLSRFDGEDFLRRNKGKKIMFVGDSLSYNQWQSLACLLYRHGRRYNLRLTHQGAFSTIFYPEHEVTITYLKNGFLVDLVTEEKGRVLRLDSISRGRMWEDADILIFNSYHWWIHGGPLKSWDYYQVGERLYRDMALMDAYKIALTTWARWVDSNTNPTKTRVFFQGISAVHYELSKDWGAASLETCDGQTEPIPGFNYPGKRYVAEQVVKDVISKMKQPAYLLDITLLTQLRKDGHPSKFAGGTLDCSHWCLAGVPDTWNQIMYTMLLKD
uniref:Putative PMR5 N-terminal domain, PC-Esterase n=1 Tax=Helianthus annuus TaxID=4232 RepID=A0A251TLV8_HELAN